MRQLGDLLVWFAMIGVLFVIVYYTPKLAEYMSNENQPAHGVAAGRSLALHLTHAPEHSE